MMNSNNNNMRPSKNTNNQAPAAVIVPVMDARMALTRSKPGQRKLNINQDKIQKESRLLVKRSMESLRGIVSKALLSESESNGGGCNNNNNNRASIKKRISRSLRTLEILEDHDYIERVYGNRITSGKGDLLEDCDDDDLPPEVWEISDYSMSQITYDDNHNYDKNLEEEEEELLLLCRSNYDCMRSNVDDDVVINDTTTTVENTENTENTHQNVNDNNNMMIEIGPGYSLQLRSSNEMWNAILDRKIIKTPCLLCQQQLYCIDDAEILSCSNCNYAFSPIMERMNNNKHNKCFGVCVGVTKEDMDDFLR